MNIDDIISLTVREEREGPEDYAADYSVIHADIIYCEFQKPSWTSPLPPIVPQQQQFGWKSASFLTTDVDARRAAYQAFFSWLKLDKKNLGPIEEVNGDGKDKASLTPLLDARRDSCAWTSHGEYVSTECGESLSYEDDWRNVRYCWSCGGVVVEKSQEKWKAVIAACEVYCDLGGVMQEADSKELKEAENALKRAVEEYSSCDTLSCDTLS